MSEYQQRGFFGLALRELERMVEVRGGIAADDANAKPMSEVIAERVRDLTLQQSSHSHNADMRDLEQLANLLKRMRMLGVGDSSLHESIATLGTTLIQQKADSHPPTDDLPGCSVQPSAFELVADIEGFIAFKNIAETTFDATDAISKQLRNIIIRKLNALTKLRVWDPKNPAVSLSILELCSKLRRVCPNQHLAMDRIAGMAIQRLRDPTGLSSSGKPDGCETVEGSTSSQPKHSLESVKVCQVLKEKYNRLEARVHKSEQELGVLKIAKKELEASVVDVKKGFRDLQLSHVRLFERTIANLGYENRVLRAQAEEEAATGSDSEVDEQNVPSEALRTQESPAEVTEDIAVMKEVNDTVRHERTDLEESLATALDEKAAMIAKVEQLAMEKAALWAFVAKAIQVRGKPDGDIARNVAANAHIESTSTNIGDEYAAVVEKAKLDRHGDQNIDGLGCATEIMSELNDQIDVLWRQNKTLKGEIDLLERLLGPRYEIFDRATVPTTATNTCDLTAENLPSETDLEAAHNNLDGIRSSLRTRLTSASTGRETSVCPHSPNTTTDNSMDVIVNGKGQNNVLVHQYATGDQEGEARSTVLTPGSSMSLPGSWTFSDADPYGVLRM